MTPRQCALEADEFATRRFAATAPSRPASDFNRPLIGHSKEKRAMEYYGQGQGAVLAKAEHAKQDMQRNQTAPRAVNPSCFGNIEDVSSHSSCVAQNVERLVDRLCGAVPSDGAKDPSTPPNGLFEEADHQARYIRDNLTRIEAAMSRLEKHLP